MKKEKRKNVSKKIKNIPDTQDTDDVSRVPVHGPRGGGCSLMSSWLWFCTHNLKIYNHLVVDKKKFYIPELETQMCLEPAFVLGIEMVCGGGGWSLSSRQF